MCIRDRSFDDEEADESGFNMESLFTIDGDAIQAAFTICLLYTSRCV